MGDATASTETWRLDIRGRIGAKIREREVYKMMLDNKSEQK